MHIAAPIMLTKAERTELEAVARSTKTEYRLHQRARIVLLAAEGGASRAIGRELVAQPGPRVVQAERHVHSLLTEPTGDAVAPDWHRRPVFQAPDAGAENFLRAIHKAIPARASRPLA